MKSARQQVRLILTGCLGVLLLTAFGGCRSSMGLFLPVDRHPDLMVEARQAIIQENPQRLDATLEELQERTPASSQTLYLLEAARLRALAGEIEASTQLYAEADARFSDELIRATFTVSGSVQAAVSVVTNDRALPYNGHLYERLLMHTFQSLNRLKLGDPELARIELNKALRDMRWGKDNLPELRKQSDARLAGNGVSADDSLGRFNASPEGLVVETSSDNALVYYLSGLLFEAQGDPDRAEIDYRNALAYAPGSTPVLQALEGIGTMEQGTARLVILHESDWVSAKIPFSFPIFIKNRSYSLSFPYYPESYTYSRYPESVIQIGGERPLLYPLLSVEAVVRKALEEQFPAILLRQALRMAAKQELQHQARQESEWLGVVASLYSILSDAPDLRSWLGLPAAVHAAELRLPAGSHEIALDIGGDALAPISLARGEIRLLHVVTAGGRVISVDSFPVSPYVPEL